jgi:hypothetical protein
MPTRPQIIFNVVSNALGNVPVSPANTIAVYGVSSAGTVLVPSDPYSVPGDVAVDFGYGPGPELAANLVASGIRTIFTKVETDTEGTVSVVTHTGTGTSVLSITGNPYRAYEISVIPSKAGTAGDEPEPSFQVSFDGGRTYSRSIRMPANRVYDGFAETTGLTLNFTAATLVVGDEYTATTTAPTLSAAGVVDALAAFRTSKSQAALHFVTGALDESGVESCVVEVNEFIEQKKFCRFVFEARDIDTGETTAQWMDAISEDFAAFTNDRICVAAGAARITSSLTGFRLRENISWLAAVRAGQVTARTQGPTFGQDLGATEDGPLVSFTQNGQGSAVTEVYYDEQLTPGLDEARFITITSYPGDDANGYYITNPNIMSGPTSDFDLLQLGRVMDEACRVTNGFFLTKISTAARVDPRTGKILEKDAKALDSGNNQVIANAIVNNGNASPMPNNQYTTVSRVDNIINTKTVTVTVKILPLSYMKVFTIQMSFFNPALSSAA